MLKQEIKNYRIDKVDKSDLVKIVNLHEEIFDGYFLKSLGSKLIYKYYKNYYEDIDTIFLKAEGDNKEILGFVLVTSKYETILYNYYKKNFIRLATRIMLEIVRLNPIIIKGLKKRVISAIDVLCNNQNKDIKDIEQESIPSVNLLSIGVCEASRGKDVARKLVSEIEILMKRRNICEYGLSVKKDNEKAKNFYNKMGFVLFQTTNDLDYMIKKIER